MSEFGHLLVTGAAGAIGSALAHALAKRYPNATLTLVDVDATRLGDATHALGHRAAAACWDLSEPNALAAQLRDAVEARGPVDILVNCAGIMEVQRLSTMPWDTASKVLTVDLVSPLRLMQLVVPDMSERGSGIVINVSSLAGVTPLRGCSYYGAAKAGLAQASEIARMELGAQGVQVLTVYPGPVSSDLERRARDQYRPSAARERIPTGTPTGLAAAVLRALDRGAPRVVYPQLFAPARHVPTLSAKVSEWLGPEPTL